MSVIPMVTPLDSPAVPSPEWVPSPESLYRFSIEQYEAMVALGAFKKRDRIHLINGFLVAKMAENPPHSAVCDGTRLALESLLPRGWYVRPDKGLRIPNYASVPEPDATVARGSWRDYEERNPEPTDVSLVVEVASTSLREDRGMARVFGAGGIPVYWIINLIDRQVEVYTQPSPDGYQSREDFKEGQYVPFVLEGLELGRIAVVDILPLRRP